MVEKKPDQALMGEHYTESGHSELYQLYRRIEDVVSELEAERQHRGMPAKRYIAELTYIASRLRDIDFQGD
jgi:hypothetical protein